MAVLRERPLENIKHTVACLLELNIDFLSKIRLHTEKHEKCTSKQKEIITSGILFMKKLLQKHAEFLSKHSTLWKKHHTIWKETLELIKTDVQNSQAELSSLVSRATEWHHFFNQYLWFLPANRVSTVPYEQFYFQNYFSSWYLHEYDNSSAAKITDTFLNEVRSLCLQTPTRSFNDKFPNFGLPKLSPDLEYPDCVLCGDPTLLCYKCNTCKNDGIVCYACFRQQLWAAHHDEYRVLTEPRELSCSFCRKPIELNTAMNNVVYTQPTPKRSSEDECLPEAKRQRLTEESDHKIQAVFSE